MNTLQAVARILKTEGVEWLSCFPSNNLIEVVAQEGIRPIMFRQERGAIMAADAIGLIIAAIVLWIVGAALGRQVGEAYMQGPKKALELKEAGQTGPNAELLALNRTSRGVVLHTLTSLVLLLIIIDMIWKPGA